MLHVGQSLKGYIEQGHLNDPIFHTLKSMIAIRINYQSCRLHQKLVKSNSRSTPIINLPMITKLCEVT